MIYVIHYWRNWWGIKCWLHCCRGDIDYDKRSTFWRCADCGKVTR